MMYIPSEVLPYVILKDIVMKLSKTVGFQECCVITRVRSFETKRHGTEEVALYKDTPRKGPTAKIEVEKLHPAKSQ